MNYSIFFYFFFFFKLFVKSLTCSGCKIVNNACVSANPYYNSCDPKCRPNFSILPTIPTTTPITTPIIYSDMPTTEPPTTEPEIFNSSCFYCPDIEENQNYYIKSNGDCVTDNNNVICNVIVYKTRQCLESCGNLKQMGGFCYTDCDNENRESDGENNCKCKSYFSKVTEDGKELWNCYNNDGPCKSYHQSFNASNKQCFEENICGPNSINENLNATFITRNDMSGIYNCSEKCKKDQKQYDGHCLDICPTEAPYYYEDNDTISICTDNCSLHDMYFNDYNDTNINISKKCLPDCNPPYFISDTNFDHCIDKCSLPFYRYKDELNRTHCTLNCTDGKFKEEGEENGEKIGKCTSHCKSGFYRKGFCIKESDKDNCFYKKEDDVITDSIFIDSILSESITFEEHFNDKECLLSCSELPDFPCYIHGTKECTICELPGYCHQENENELFPINGSVSDLPTDSFYTEPDKYICNCFLYAMINKKKFCFKDGAACRKKGFLFRIGNECVKVCKPFFEVKDDDSIDPDSYLRICLNSVDECKSKGYYYYNIDLHTCWRSCPEGMYSIEANPDNNRPKEDNTRSTCVEKCGEDFPKHTKDRNICKRECDDNEFFTLDEPNICLSTCEGAYPSDTIYFGENHECLKGCGFNKFILKTTTLDRTHYRCVSKCADYGKYYVNNDQKCYDNCTEIKSDYPYHYYNRDNRCLTSCLFNDLSEKYSIKITDENQIYSCRETNETKYYYEEDKIISYDPCELSYPNNKFKCLYNCDSGFVLPNGTCLNESCPSEYPYYNNESLIINNQTVYIRRCKSICPNFTLIYSYKCLDECPRDYSVNGTLCYPNCKYWQKFNLSTGECQETCTSSYYENTTYYGSPPIYICKNKCLGEKKFIKDIEDHECVSICPKKNNFIEENITCVSNCSSSYPYYYKIESYDSNEYPIYHCVKFCPLEYDYKYIKYDNQRKGECLKKCPENYNFTLEGNLIECFSSCPDGYYWDLTNKKCYKYNFCLNNTDGKNYYFNGTCYTLKECYEINHTYAENFHCVDECKIYKYKEKTEHGTIKCIEKCGENASEYIDSGNYCVTDCPKGKNFIGKNRTCKAQCNGTDGDYYYEFKTKDDYTIYKCSEQCSNETYYLEGYNTTQCFKECPSHLPYISINENMCYNNCLSSPIYNFTMGNQCFSSCNLTYNYYYERNQTCLSSCNEEDFAIKISDNNYIFQCVKNCSFVDGFYNYTNETGKFCFRECPSDKPFVEDNICVENCSEQKKFYVKEFKHYGDNLQKICLTDCPKEYPFYTPDAPSDKIFGCINTCDKGFKVLNYSDRRINATLCLDSCPQTGYPEYKYQIIDNNNKTCYSICPPEKPFHKDTTKDEYKHDNNCYETCPEETPFTDVGGIICKSEKDCEGKYIDYEKKTCLSYDFCPKYRKLYSHFYINGSTDDENTKVICLDYCREKYGKYLTPNGTCVKLCNDTSDPLVKDFHLINDPRNNSCICENLYIINDNLKMECLPETINETKCKTVGGEYSIKMYESKECVKVCNDSNTLSATEDICYKGIHDCSGSLLLDDKNTELINKTNGQHKCECKFKFYFTEDFEYPDFKKKICLDEDGLCPKDYGKFIPETLECIKTNDSCPSEFNILFLGKFCLRDIPRNSSYNDTGKYYQCVEPNEYWHETDENRGNFECLDKCLDKYPVYVPTTNQCLTTCKGSLYPYFYENKCYNSCDNDKLLNIENGFVTNISEYSEYADYSNLTKYTNFVCDCHNPWFYNDQHKKICADSKVEYSILDCNNFTNPNPNPIYDHLIRKTLQCVDHCPKAYNYLFNYDCFADCEEASYYYHYVTNKNIKDSYECICENLWFYEPNNKIQCIDPNVTECVVYDYERKFFDKKYFDKKYLVNETNECINTCPNGSYIFNYVCYEKCPKDTQDNPNDLNDPNCTCNTEVGYWYEYEKYNLTYFQCALESCPINNSNSKYIRENLLESESKCLISCNESAEYPFSLRKVCVKECPFFTFITGEFNDICTFLDLYDERVDTLEKLHGAASIQVSDLYEDSKKSGGLIVNKLNTSLQIYSVDRKNSLKEVSFKSNLTYIDFGTCLDKLMIDKNITGNESVLITKYDILPEANVNIPPDISENFKDDKYLINPVEYELYSSLTNEKLDALVCDPYEILISYPLILSKFDKYIDGKNQNEYRRKFNLGRELYLKDNEVDTFNYNDTVYTHFCKDLEIHGKDLVFEDRYKNLYPNNKLLCESNCTYNNTDFLQERVNCLCTYKDTFDFERKEEEINDILNNPDFYLPTQSQTNAEIIKCLFNFTLKQAIAKNEMFYCCTIMTLAQIAMVVISSCVSIKNMINDIRHILNKVNIKNYFLKKSRFFKNGNIKIDTMLSSTNRFLNNPPKKEKSSEENKSDSKDNEKIEHDFINSKLETISKINKGNDIILEKDKIYSSTDNKAEYIPPDYNFKFFKLKDKGVMKKIERSKIPFEVNPDTDYLIERREGVDYPDDYLEGPYLKSQNILVIVEGKVKKERKTEKSNVDKSFSINIVKKGDKMHDDKMETQSQFKISKLFDAYKSANNTNDEREETQSQFRITKLFDTYKKENNDREDTQSQFRITKLFDTYRKENNDKKYSTVKTMKSNLKQTNKEKIEFNPEIDLRLNDEGNGFFESIRREQVYLRINYEKYLQKKHNNIYILFLADIFDKIYLIKIFLFIKKFDILCVQISLYLFYHILLMSLLCGFFTIKVIKKIWDQDNFPNLNFYLLYGFITHIIVWIIYQMLGCLLDYNGKIKDMITLKYELIENQYREDFDRENIHDTNEGIYKEKYDELIYQLKCRIAIYFVLAFIFTSFFTIYLISFFSYYTGTKNRVLTAYYISIIEILLIKICYGILLSSLRLLSTKKKIKLLYNIIYFFDKHIS